MRPVELDGMGGADGASLTSVSKSPVDGSCFYATNRAFDDVRSRNSAIAAQALVTVSLANR
jgi:hypothetical protein